jgi:hypothetical protein
VRGATPSRRAWALNSWSSRHPTNPGLIQEEQGGIDDPQQWLGRLRQPSWGRWTDLSGSTTPG